MSSLTSTRRRRIAGPLVTTLLLLGAAMLAQAGEFFEKNGIALDGYDPVGYFSDQKPVRGSTEFTAEYKGSMFHFSTASHRDQFRAAPEKFVPQFGGFCAYGAAGGYKAKIEPEAFSIIDGKLYLNYNAKVQSEWSKDTNGYIAKAEKQWPAMSTQTKVIP